MAFTVRLDDEQLLSAFDQIARLHGFSRNNFIEHLIRQKVEGGFIPIKHGEGLKATSPSGGNLSLILTDEYVTSGYNNLTKDEEAVFRQAEKFAKIDAWASVRALLVSAEFQVEAITST